MPVRYMGTKCRLTPFVREAVMKLRRKGPAADLFCGMGSVVSCLAPDVSVVANDILGFPTAFARARFTDSQHQPVPRVEAQLHSYFRSCQSLLLAEFERRLANEEAAIEKGADNLLEYMWYAPHVGNSRRYRSLAQFANKAKGRARYKLVTLYFSSGYFSTAQAIDLDALRYAIDMTASEVERDWLLSAWISAASLVINSPGHTAQFLKPNNETVFDRIVSQWSRPIWPTFMQQLAVLKPTGNQKWRKSNRVINKDAIRALDDSLIERVSVVYADPPYTKDSYARFYHLYETLYRYDYPESKGAGRYPSERVDSIFSKRETVALAFTELAKKVRDLGVPLVLSYPSHGLLIKTGIRPEEILSDFFKSIRVRALPHTHSTMGASAGKNSKKVLEKLYVCT